MSLSPLTHTPMLYGIPNCDVVKKARLWLKTQGIVYQFYDFKKQGVPVELLTQWALKLGWETLLNRKGTTWRGLSEMDRASIVNADVAIRLMTEYPSAIKRPVLCEANVVHIGFDAALWHTLFFNPL